MTRPTRTAASCGIAPAFGQLLRQRRTILGRALWQIAACANISPDRISRYERGRAQRIPTLAILQALARALDLSPNALMAAALGLSEVV
jgi:transcriptional regulator with XRE-family HTH domain